ncbi:MAG: hypothetical protein HY902_13795 [Deltaproteobacteria bacterium]|nr:hypothetical protein [Deltaproteobacteria bacterium]
MPVRRRHNPATRILRALGPALVLLLAAPHAARAEADAGSSDVATPVKAPVDERDQLSAKFEAAYNAFKYQDFDAAIPQLRALLYPKPRLDLRRELRAREWLGAALWWTNKRDEAMDEFTALLLKQPAARLDPAQYPPKMIDDFDQRRRRLVDTGILSAEAVAGDPLLLPELARPEPPPMGLMFFPMGVGQFANRQPTKGWLFLASEALLAGTSLGMYWYNAEVGLSGPRPLRNDVLQISAGAAFWLVAGWGVWDAVSTWRQQWPDKPQEAGKP